MAVNRNLSKQLTDNWDAGQYPLFATGSDLAGLMESGRLGSESSNYDDSVAVMRNDKLDEAREDGLMDSIEKHGIKEPVDIWLAHEGGPDLLEGHHRVFSAEDIEKRTGKPVFVPIEYDGIDYE